MSNFGIGQYCHTGLVAGATSVSHYVNLRTVSGAAATGLTFATGGLVASYTRTGTTRAAITLATQTPTGTWSSGGFVEVSSANAPGLYRIDLPNAALAAGVAGVVISIKGTGLQPYHALLPLEVATDSGAGTASGTPTTTSFTFAGLTATDGSLARRLIQFIEGPAAGERVLVVANSTSVIQVAPPFAVAPATANRFLIL